MEVFSITSLKEIKIKGIYKITEIHSIDLHISHLTEVARLKEKITEEKLVIAVKQMGGICPKFVSPGFDGMPDRLVLLPFGKVAFVEVKAANKKPRPLQKARHKMLKRLGFKVYVLDDAEQIGGIIDEVQTT